MRRVLCSLLFLLAAAVPTVFAEEVDERDSNRLTLDIYTFGFQHLVYKIQSTETGCFGTYPVSYTHL